MIRSRLARIPLVVAGLATAASARADGAFPDSNNVLVPRDRPNDIVLGTNFGLISSNDGGATWEWSCETKLTTLGQAYQLGISLGETFPRVVASSLWGVVYSDDASCHWQGSAGDVAQADAVTDVFVQPANPLLAHAIGVQSDPDAGQREAAFASSDGGASFGAPIFVGPSDGGIWGIESAATDPRTIYVSFVHAPQHPGLAVTHDAGATWNVVDLEPALGSSLVRIIAVDGANADMIFLRASSSSGDVLAVSRDGGASFTKPFTVTGALTAFVRRSNGTILVGGLGSDSQAVGARSTDGGATFAPWPGVPHLRALAERDGLLYGAADNFADRFALGVSSDESNWRPLLSYNDVTRIKPCVAAACQVECRNKVDTAFWSASVCDASDGGSDRSSDSGAGRQTLGSNGSEGGTSSLTAEPRASCSFRPTRSNRDFAFGALAMCIALALRRSARAA